MLIPSVREQTDGVVIIGRLQLCWGNVDIPANETHATKTFIQPFSYPPMVFLTNANVYADDVFWSSSNTRTSSFDVYGSSVSKGNSVMLRARYLAIGIKD